MSSITRLESALEEEGVIAERNKRKRAAVNPSFTLNFTPRDRLRTDYLLYNTQYHRTTDRDYTGQDVSLAWLHDLKNERSTLKIPARVNQTRLSRGRDNPGEEIRDRTVRRRFRTKHRFTETTDLECSAGARFTESDIRDGDDTTDQSGGFIGNAVFTWQYERNSTYKPCSRATTNPAPLAVAGPRCSQPHIIASFHRKTQRRHHTCYRRTDREKKKSLIEKVWSFSVVPSARYRITPSVRPFPRVTLLQGRQGRRSPRRNGHPKSALDRTDMEHT